MTIYLIFMLLLNHYALRTPPPFAYDLARFNGESDQKCSKQGPYLIPIIEQAWEIWPPVTTNETDPKAGCYQIEGKKLKSKETKGSFR